MQQEIIGQYDKYVNILNKEDYFKKWSEEDKGKVPENIREKLYNKYLVKAQMLNRDEFTCQNTECKYPHSRLTMHHVKWQKNGGQDKLKNAVTLCRACHANFHKARASITFANDALPAHINGHTFKLESPEPRKDWKKLKSEMKELRTRLKQSGMKAIISWEDVYILMRWLFDMDAEDVDDD